MPHKTDKPFSYWDIKTSIAKSIAGGPEPSIEKLRHDILEEFGYPPEPELIHLFLQLSPQQNKKGNNSSEDDKRLFAENIAQGPAPSVLKFRKEFLKEYNLNPTNELTSYFLQKIQDCTKTNQAKDTDQMKFDFAKTKAQESRTVLQFRTTYRDTFQEEPSSDLVTFFLKNLSKSDNKLK